MKCVCKIICKADVIIIENYDSYKALHKNGKLLSKTEVNGVIEKALNA